MSNNTLARLASVAASALLVSTLLSCETPQPQNNRIDALTPPQQPRNVVFILVDTLRAGNLSFLGYRRTTTPHIDEIAAQSVVFTRAVSVGGNTPTAMAAIMTGRYPYFRRQDPWRPADFGMARFYGDGDDGGLPEGIPVLAEKLQSAGYHTLGVITNPYLKSVFHFDRGFDSYDEILHEHGIPYGKCREVTNRAIQLLGQLPDPPFFLYLHFMDTHGPYNPPEEERAAFLRPQSKRLLEQNDFSELWNRWERRIAVDPEPGSLRDLMTDLYDASIHSVDGCINDVLQELSALSLDETTIVAFSADHGEEFLEHGGTTHKGTLYEELLHVPLFIKIPGVQPQRSTALVRNFDIGPTILQLSGASLKSSTSDAVSLSSLLHGEADSLNLLAYANFPGIRVLRSKNLKIISREDGATEAYNLSSDPGETANLFEATALPDEQMTRLQNLRAKLGSIATSIASRTSVDAEPSTGDGLGIPDKETQQQLRALGYLK